MQFDEIMKLLYKIIATLICTNMQPRSSIEPSGLLSFFIDTRISKLLCEYSCGLIHTGYRTYIKDVWGCNTPSVCVLFVKVGPKNCIGRKNSVSLKSERNYHFETKLKSAHVPSVPIFCSSLNL